MNDESDCMLHAAGQHIKKLEDKENFVTREAFLQWVRSNYGKEIEILVDAKMTQSPDLHGHFALELVLQEQSIFAVPETNDLPFNSE